MSKSKNLEGVLGDDMGRYRLRSRRLKHHGISEREGWVVKNVRPEEELGNPAVYYTDEEVDKYSRSGGMRRAQEKIAYRVLELLGLKSGALLDIGCGPGYTAEVYRSEGYNVTGVDVIPRMVDKARERGFEAYVGDMRHLGDILPDRKFDGVVSVSALQWIKDDQELKRVASGVYRFLDKGSPLVMQFYPKREDEARKIARIFQQNGFTGNVVIDSPDVPKNRTVYLVMKRS